MSIGAVVALTCFMGLRTAFVRPFPTVRPLLSDLQIGTTAPAPPVDCDPHGASQPAPVLNFDNLLATAERLLPRFVRCCLPLEYKAMGVLYSEALALVSAMSLAGVDIMIESGTANGFSTELMARFFNETALPIVTIDSNPESPLVVATVERLRNFSHVSFVFGDGGARIPALLEEHRNKKIGVFVDGPKHWSGLALCMKALRASPNVKFCAIHDSSPAAFASDFAAALEEQSRTVLYTWNPAWRRAFSPMDQLTSYKPGPGKWGTYGWGVTIFAGLETMPFGVKGDTSALRR